jgi:CBS domain containing-hemolysin-like protein
MDLEEVNELLNLDLPVTDDYQTLGGFILFHLQKIPQPGEVLRYEDYEFTVISADGPRLDQIQIHRLEMPETISDAELNFLANSEEKGDRFSNQDDSTL